MRSSRLQQLTQSLPPVYFSFIMATGIVSIGAHVAGLETISIPLFWLNKAVYVYLMILLAGRLLFFFPALLTELTSHDKGPGFFTIVAGSAVLGVQYKLLEQNNERAMMLLVFAVVVWVLVVYTFFVGTIVESEKPTLEKGLNGTWLLLVVSTQSLAVLGTLLTPHLPYSAAVGLLSTVCAFLLGFLFYFIFVTLILYRLLFMPEKAENFTPPYWIDMGAVAITTLAGATLTETIKTTVGTGLVDMLPFIKGISILAWATATWWIPLIILLEIWQHGVKRVPLTYSPPYWSLVFPLGMYTVCTWRLSEALRLPFLRPAAHACLYVALIAWALTFLGLCIQTARSLSQQPG
ncbi:tellurite resistance/C4-dicarboxylate transporter family protein [Spirosoma sp.]|uniref:tellurite resistance/C4-dicarboxylate transporter family protein n=1 Tax=Spirosoma sp. TaxID=1899569 RepID=UPI0026187622|nr:tellurite resistance/C4-dicarboxylate transporter family protein [Spirosoma sp.]MCX6218618.1 tellurite resistance/C4-dicarboxylate transporter family protein [Spirosoma sp.]